MQPFFNSPARCLQLSETAAQWSGTPFRQRSAIPGRLGGTDCVCLVGAILRDLGVLAHFDPQALPEYSYDWHHHTGAPLLDEYLDRMGLTAIARRIESVDALQPGDVIVFALEGRPAHHMGITISPALFLHCYLANLRTQQGFVHTAPLQHPMLKRWFAYALRPLEK